MSESQEPEGSSPRRVVIPELALVVLVGVSGAGKSTFAARHFGRFEVISSDFCRGLVSDDENDQTATDDAFTVLDTIVGTRLRRGHLTVVDATNVQEKARQQLISLARAHDVLPVAIVLDVPESLCRARNAVRPDRDFGPDVIRRQHALLRRSLKHLNREGFRGVHVLRPEDLDEGVELVREKLLNDHRELTGPFDVIGDVHGCRSELLTLLARLGYRIELDQTGRAVDAMPPEGRTAVFLGDLVDRGPDSPGVLRLVMGMVAAGHALCVPGNHENKLIRALQGAKVQLSHGLAETLDQLSRESEEFRAEVLRFCHELVSHQVLDGGRLVIAHAGLIEAYQGRASGRVRSFALYGDTTGETDEYGLPVRYPWAHDYRGRAMVLYGHTPTTEVTWVNNTLCLDTGCVFGGMLTALRYPEREIVSVPAERVWYEPARPLAAAPAAGPARADGVLDIRDVLGTSGIDTAYHGRVAVRDENAAGALEVMSRFALDPSWLPYLPATMAPCATSSRPDLLEHPEEAFAGYAQAGVETVICEEKHMGSRAVALICRDEQASRRFQPDGGRLHPPLGVVYTRTGRPFFPAETGAALVDRLRTAVTAAGLWQELGTDWLLLDTELMPWSAKALELLRGQYASVAAAARTALPMAASALREAAQRGLPVGELLERTLRRAVNAEAFATAYRRYCWPTEGLDGLRLAPFQVLASAGESYHDRDHLWHLDVADRLVAADPALIAPTRRCVVDTTSAASLAAGVEWWEELTGAGGEGMVVKPLANLCRGPKGLVQPGVKVRGREYLRIIYGPDYTEPEHLARLKERHLGRKRSLALREYALGIEALERVARGEPLWRVHEAVFAVLALESEPVDPRL